ncbi:transposon, En/Spm-like protein [Tanacetum coccineum]
MLLNEDDFKAAERYVLLNCTEMMPFVEEFDKLMIDNNPNIGDGELDQLRDLQFSKWVKKSVCQDMEIDIKIRDLCSGPNRYATFYNSCFVNRYKFHTNDHCQNKTTVNSGVCIKGSTYNEFEKDYFGILLNVVQLHYVGNKRVTMFLCHWYDNEKGITVDGKHGLVDVNSKSKLSGNDPFVLAEQAQQVYYTPYPSRKRSRSDWLAVCKTTARSSYNTMSNIVEEDEVVPTAEGFYQENEMPSPTVVGLDVDLDDVITLPSVEVEEVEHEDVPTHIINPSNSELDPDDEEEFMDEDEDEDEGDDGDDEDEDDDGWGGTFRASRGKGSRGAKSRVIAETLLHQRHHHHPKYCYNLNALFCHQEQHLILRDFTKEAPNPEAAAFFKLLHCADEPLWDGCKNHTRLSAVSQLMNCKSDYNMSESCYNRIISLVKSMLPQDAVLPDDFYNRIFRDICLTVIDSKHIETLEKNIVETLCKLEKIFPPSFFDSMEHLPIHLAYEARVGGPEQYR